jgi:hypothetical protein
MTLEQEFKEKVGFSAYENNQMQPKVYNESYVEWLEAKINYTRCCTELPTSTQLLSDCKKRFKDLRANNYKFDYISYLNGYLDSFSKYAVSKTK